MHPLNRPYMSWRWNLRIFNPTQNLYPVPHLRQRGVMSVRIPLPVLPVAVLKVVTVVPQLRRWNWPLGLVMAFPELRHLFHLLLCHLQLISMVSTCLRWTFLSQLQQRDFRCG